MHVRHIPIKGLVYSEVHSMLDSHTVWYKNDDLLALLSFVPKE